MARKKRSAYENFRDLYKPVFTKQQVLGAHPEGKGDITDLVEIWSKEVREEGASDDNIEANQAELAEAYNRGDRGVFFEPLQRHLTQEIDKFVKFGEGNLENIIDGTDDEILGEIVLPYVIKNYNTNSEKYGNLNKLIDEIRESGEKLKKLQNPETEEDIVKELIDEKIAYYESKYKGNEYLIDLFKKLISPELEERRFKNKHIKKSKELQEELDNNLKGYIKSVGLTKEDFVNIYSSIFNKSYQEADSQSAQLPNGYDGPARNDQSVASLAV